MNTHDLESMKIMFGNRSPSTILMRGTSILQVFEWYKSRYFHFCPFPATPESVEEYLQHLKRESKPASTMHGFVEALNFCRHFLGMNVNAGEKFRGQ